MPQEVQIQVLPEVASDKKYLYKLCAKKLAIDLKTINKIVVLKRSIDARQRQVKVNFKIRVFINEDYQPEVYDLPNYKSVKNAESIYIVGAGPAGLFAALKCIEIGKKPIVIERGKDVQSRRRDLKAININHIVNENSNYCFGEGGAGTYSDGKLYTRSKKRGDVDNILKLLVAFGADKDILVDAHPHIGTNKLPEIIIAIRTYIIEKGGAVRFESKLTDIIVEKSVVKAIEINGSENIDCDKLILATGHSARDIFELLHNKKIDIEAKPFALGVRVEHPQVLIDQIQYKCKDRGEYLPPAPYTIAKQVDGRGVYSFCMCPGGVIAPCATSQDEVVTNGWSPSKRDQPSANSGVVVELKLSDFAKYESEGALAGMMFQKEIEHKAWELAGKTQKVPAQRLLDFIEGKKSKDIPPTSYLPGTTSVNLKEVLPPFIYDTLKKGFIDIGKSMQGYLTNEAVVHAPESRTSSPIRIPRDKETLEHITVKGLYPCGEGAGYAGGIISAAIDGEKSATAASI